MEQLRAQSTILDFRAAGPLFGGPPESYLVRFHGRGAWRRSDSHEPMIREHHEVQIQLGAGYPRMMPELAWKTPIFHPNISAGGIVCLGGYATHWVPSLHLDELCQMLWDMIRYRNFDTESPYNREAAYWARTQQSYVFPLDTRPLRNQADGRSAGPGEIPPVVAAPLPAACGMVFLDEPPMEAQAMEAQAVEAQAVEAQAVEAQVVEAQVVDVNDPEILFLE